MIETGTALGPYQILEPLGAGGMGEVYKARDTRLDRVVAVKVLPAHLSHNAEHRERFEREARAISGLNHPHICTLHDIGRQGDIDFLVMEYLEGETLAVRLTSGGLPLDQALALAIQIADALDRAHRHGIVHRDLKPANVMLTRVGAKLLDFGLAKLNAGPHAAGSGSMLPTVMPSANLTAQGSIVGTLQYMAPEQLEGLEADARTDIFAFGSLVYEMITGRKAFQGKSQPSLISAIMSADAPAISAVQPMSPPALDHLVKTCLAKDPADRWQTAHDVMAQLKWIAAGGSQIGVPAPVAAGRRARGRLMIGLLAFAALLVAAMSVPTVLYFRGTPPPGEIRFTIETPPTPNPTFFAVSPDGRSVVLQARSETGPALFLRRLDSTAFERLPGTEGGAAPFWSPDGRSIAFFTASRLRKVDVAGGAAQDVVGEAEGPASWGSRNIILFRRKGALHAVDAAGGEPRPVLVSTGPMAAFPTFLPDGNHFIYTAMERAPGIYVAALDASDAHLLVSAPSSAVYADPGLLLFQRQGTVFAQSFDPGTREISGEPIQIADQVYVNRNGRMALGASQDGGVLIYRANVATAPAQFAWYDRTGRALELLGKPDVYRENFDLSPDVTQVALSIFDRAVSGSKLWVMDWARGVTTPFTFEATGTDVVWSPDGLKLAYSRIRGRSGGADILEKNASGLGEERVLLDGPDNEYVEDWSKDGRYIAYVKSTDQDDIWVLPLFGDRSPFAVAESPFQKDEPHFSFDTKWLAYASTESGTWQVYVISFPAMDQKRQISNAGGSQPRWNRDGTELYYLSLDGTMMAADIRTGARLDSGIPRPLFETGLVMAPTLDQYAVTPDGQRFLLLKPVGDESEAPMTVVVNWTSRLEP